jgi:hypothetical protein
MQDAEKNKKRQPINIHNMPRIIKIPPSEFATEILVTFDENNSRVWFDGLPADTNFAKPTETIDTKP